MHIQEEQFPTEPKVLKIDLSALPPPTTNHQSGYS